MCRLLETIRVERREFHNLSYHSERMNRSRREILGCTVDIDLEAALSLPDTLGMDRHKCRVIYGTSIETVEFELYHIKPVSSLKLVDGGDIDYRYKYVDRSALQELQRRRGECDDILIARDGRICDTSYANVALFDGERWYTPESCLLAGTMRAKLIDDGVLTVVAVGVDGLKRFSSLAVINAMVDLGEVVMPIDSIR